MLDGLKADVDRALTKSSTYFGTLDNHSLNVGCFLQNLTVQEAY